MSDSGAILKTAWTFVVRIANPILISALLTLPVARGNRTHKGRPRVATKFDPRKVSKVFIVLNVLNGRYTRTA